MKSLSFISCAVVAALLTACTDDGDADRGGPDALRGFTWQSKASANGVDFRFGFTFSDASVEAFNTCSAGGQSLTARVTAPVKYRYRATVPTAGHSGDASCFVDVAAATFDFELVGDALVVTYGDQRLEFQRRGAANGLYSEWAHSADGFTLVWSMGSGRLRARAECAGGATANVSVGADYHNYLDILETQTQRVGDDAFDCSVGVERSMAEYRFAGDDLILTIGGNDTRFSH